MSAPVITPPVALPVGGQTVQPRDMVAVRTIKAIDLDVRLPDGTIVKKTVSAGCLGYVAGTEGGNSVVQIINASSKRALCM
jgi:hypothetical protein